MTPEEKQRAEELRKLKEDYRRTFLATPHGLRVLKDILDACQVFEYHTDVRSEGKRDIGLTVLNALDKRSYKGLIELQDRGMDITDLERE